MSLNIEPDLKKKNQRKPNKLIFSKFMLHKMTKNIN